MTGPEHYKRGEQILADIERENSDIYPVAASRAVRMEIRAAYSATALAHFAAAQAAATAMTIKSDGYSTVADWRGAVLR